MPSESLLCQVVSTRFRLVERLFDITALGTLGILDQPALVIHMEKEAAHV